MPTQPRPARTLPDPQSEPTLTVARAAAVLGVGEATLRRAIRDAGFPHIRLGARVVVPTAALLAKLALPTTDQPSLADPLMDHMAAVIASLAGVSDRLQTAYYSGQLFEEVC